MTAYRTTCLRCGRPLQPVASGPESVPWRCSECHVGWWAAELTESARDSYRTERHDFRPRAPVLSAVEAEARDALLRGTSLRSDQVGSVSHDVLEATQKVATSSEFQAQIAAILKGGSP